MSPRSVSSIAFTVWSMPSESDVVCTAPEIPRPVKMSSILPTPKTGQPAAARRSSSVSPAGGTGKSRRFGVRLKFSRVVPTKGRAITRQTPY